MIPQIRFDIINISIYLTIKNECMNVNSPFFDDLYTLYRLGYIPCGYAKGKYKVLQGEINGKAICKRVIKNSK